MSAPAGALGERDRGPVREIPTPEGVPLRFTLALAGDRAAAFLLDSTIIAVTLFVIALVAELGSLVDQSAAESLVLISFFALRNFYFAGLEILWRGRTIGKRVIGLQVIDRSGRALRVEALFARNLTREIEVFIPLMVILAGEALIPGMSAEWRIGTILWAIFFAIFPFFNRDRLRLGDLLAGTLVVRSPRPALLPDLAATPAQPPAGGEEVSAEHAFARGHLEAYGIYELQVLEKILRQPTTPAQTVKAVAEKIAEKIEWPGPILDSRKFLEDFYRAQRAHLEGRLLLGDRREDKAAAAARRRDGPGGAGSR